MASTPQRPKGRIGSLSTLDVLIQVLTPAKDTCDIPPAQVAFGSAVALLTMIRVRSPPVCHDQLLTPLTQDLMADEQDYVLLGLSCGDVCQTLDRGLNGRGFNELNQPVLEAIGTLTT
jgi:hypothetical protein